MRLINADELFPGVVMVRADDGLETAQRILDAINNAPTVDAVEVCRCKDCKLRCPESISVYRHCALSGMMVDDDDFCSYGERRADE